MLGLLWSLNKLLFLKHLEYCLEHRKSYMLDTTIIIVCISWIMLQNK